MDTSSDTLRTLDETLWAIDSLFSARGPLSEIKSDYVPRPEQIQLAKETARAIHGADTLLGDCPTGTGKSLGYLAAGVLAGKPLVVSTASIALQSQLLSQDLPLLKRAVSRLYGYPEDEGFTYAVTKGRSNYLCQRRFSETLSQPGFVETEVLQDLVDFRDSTSTGDREDLHKPVPASRWFEVASDGEDCAPSACSFREGCFYYAHRDKAAKAQVLVANHSLLMANAATYGSIFDVSGRHLIADEAHRLEEVMSEAFGMRISRWRIKYAMRQAAKKKPEAGEYADRVESAADLFFDELRVNQTLGSEKTAPKAYGKLYDGLRSVAKLLRSDTSEEVVKLSSMVVRLHTELKAFYSDPLGTHAYAVMPGRAGPDPTRKPYPELRSWLIQTGDVFRDEVLRLFSDKGKVLVSATLAASRSGDSGGSGEAEGSESSGCSGAFRYARQRLGISEEDVRAGSNAGNVSKESRGGDVADGADGSDGSDGSDGVNGFSGVNGGDKRVPWPAGEIRELVSPEIFDYSRRALIYTEPATGRAGGDQDAVRRAEELVEISGGNALVLLSTSRAVKAFRDGFDTGYPVRFQGDDSPGRLVQWLRETDGGVLVGTRSFWEGVDVPGPSLGLVIIDRVPFAPPDDPVIAALVEKAGKAWFSSVTLPKAQVALRQGAGRLMRTASDRGVIALLDGRISSKPWGKAVMNSLPDAPVTDDIEDVRALFRAYFSTG